MALSTAIYNILSAGANITTTFGDRICPIELPEGEVIPCITYRIDSVEPTFSQDPPQSNTKQWDTITATLTIYADTYTLCETYAGYVRTAITHYRATTGSETVKECLFMGMSDGDIYMKGQNESVSTGIGVFSKVIQMQFTTSS